MNFVCFSVFLVEIDHNEKKYLLKGHREQEKFHSLCLNYLYNLIFLVSKHRKHVKPFKKCLYPDMLAVYDSQWVLLFVDLMCYKHGTWHLIIYYHLFLYLFCICICMSCFPTGWQAPREHF